MMVLTRVLSVLSEGNFYSEVITERVRDVVKQSGIREGVAFVFYKHTTGGVIIIEHETGVLVDIQDLLERILPSAGDYAHHKRGYDVNGAAHVGVALLGVSVHVPVLEGDLQLGDFQEIVVLDMDTTRRERSVIVQVIGE
jgi:secondary thiamine-phosphate synthase enzyme